jgi:IS30 family transposase
MEQEKGSTPTRKGKHLNWTECILIKAFLKAGISESSIAKELGRDRRTINREVERGLVEHLNSDLTTRVAYSADRAQDVHDLNASAKGPAVKLKANSAAVEFVRCHIVIKRWSPKKGMEDTVCAKTIYTHIEKGEIQGVSKESLWEKRKRGKKNKSLHRWAKRGTSVGRSIDERPDHSPIHLQGK